MTQKKTNQTEKTCIRFYLNGRLCVVEECEPTTTVLNYLRENLLQTASKEGCAEGDCGACTIVTAESHQGRIRFRSINSCIQFLPTLDGKLVFTAEGLGQTSTQLHPVQQAMVDCHGSQCGFCTPGFIMSLFTLYKSQPNPGRDEIDDALAGNLCRCTGYRPIISAASKMYELGKQQSQSGDFLSIPCPPQQQEITKAEQAMLQQLEDITVQSCLSFGQAYFAPVTTSELAGCYDKYPDATLLAGGTDVGLWVTKQMRELKTVIYLGQVDDLNSIDINDDVISIAARVSLADAFDELLQHYPDLAEIARRFASPPIRSAGTLCGNIANGSPIGDSMPALLALGAELLLRKGEQTRILPLDQFYLDYQKKDLKKGEFVEAVRIPRADAEQHFRSYKISKRFDQDISALCAAYSLQLHSGKVEQIRIAYGGMAAIPKRALHCETTLSGKTWDEATVEQAIHALGQDFSPLSDMRASAEYRLQVAGNLLKRFYHEVNGADQGTTHVLRYAG